MPNELRRIVRRLSARRAVTLSLVVTLAIGVGATTAVFSIVNAAVLRPLPYPRSEDIYALGTAYADGRWSTGRISAEYVAELSESAPSVDDVVAYRTTEDIVVVGGAENRQALVRFVSDGFFDLFGRPATLGRTFAREDHELGSAAVVLSNSLWREAFGSDPSVVGQSVQLATDRYTVVGIAPADFDVPQATDLWISMELPREGPGAVGHTYEGYLRVRPTVTEQGLRSDLDAAMARVAEAYPEAAGGRTFVVRPLLDTIVGDLAPISLLLLGAAILLLFLASINVAAVVVARSAEATREAAIRTALGAQRRQIAGSLLVESSLISAAGALLGVAVAWIGVRLLVLYGGTDLPRASEIPIDGTVFVFAGTVLVTIALITGLLPLARLPTPNLTSLLHEGGRTATLSRRTHRLLSSLVVGEIAFSIAVLSSAGWLARSYASLVRVEPGFEATGRLVFTAYLGGTRWAQRPVLIEGPDGRPMVDPNQPPSDTPRTWLATVTERLRATGQVEAVGSANALPLGRDWDSARYIAVRDAAFDPLAAVTARGRGVSPSFFEAMGTRLLAGRSFSADDGTTVAIVNEAFVDRFIPTGDPLLASFSHGFPAVNFGTEVSIIGVVEDVRYTSLRDPAEPIFYVPAIGTRQAVVVSTTVEEADLLLPFVRAELDRIDPLVPVTVESLQTIVDSQTARYRIGLTVMALFGAISLALAAIGIHGVVSYVTTQRSRELATRMALGATSGRIQSLVLRDGALLAALGAAMGLGLAIVAGPLTTRLYQGSASDPVVLTVAVATVLAVSIAAFWVPALRAARRGVSEGLSID